MKTVIIDFTGAKHIYDLHEIIKQSFQSTIIGFPDFYGKNLNALWDCLTGFIETPVEVILTGIDNLDKDFDDEVNGIIKVFKRAVERYGEIKFSVK